MAVAPAPPPAPPGPPDAPPTAGPDSGMDVRSTQGQGVAQEGAKKKSRLTNNMKCLIICGAVCLAIVLAVIGLVVAIVFGLTNIISGTGQMVENFVKTVDQLAKEEAERSRNITMNKNGTDNNGMDTTTEGTTTEKENNPHKWFEQGCWNYEEVCKGKSGKPKLVVFSFDGFAHSYLERDLVKNVKNMAECGVKAKQVLPSFPSKTLPSHYTIATGKYPGTHGILANKIFDNGNLVALTKSREPQYFAPEPIWSLYQRVKKNDNKKAGAYNWYGSWQYGDSSDKDAKPKGLFEYNPNHNPTNTQKVEQVIEWLKDNETDYGLLMAYFKWPDVAGHTEGPNSKMVNDSLTDDVDNVIGEFLNKLQENNLECTDFAIVSDHGMAKINTRVDMTKYNTKEVTVDDGIVSSLYLKDPKPDNKLRDSVLDKITCSDHMHKFTKKNLPPRLHFAKNKRAPDITLIAELGATLWIPKPRLSDQKTVWDEGQHGQDYLVDEMRTVFFAQGPSFKKNVVLPTFENVHYYGLFSEILGIDASEVPEHDGIYGSLRSALKNPKNTVDKFYAETTEIGQCSDKMKMVLCDGTAASPVLKKDFPDVGKPDDIDSSFVLHFKGTSSDLCVNNWGQKTSTFYDGEDVSILYTTLKQKQKAYSTGCPKCSLSFEAEASAATSCTLPSSTGTSISPRNTPITKLHEASKDMYAGTVDIWKLVDARTDKYVADSKTPLTVYSGVYENPKQRFFYRVIVGCSTPDREPKDCVASQLRVISFLVPNFKKKTFCYEKDDLLIQYTARVTDIERMTGLRFFMNLQKNNYETIVRLKSSPPLTLDFLKA